MIDNTTIEQQLANTRAELEALQVERDALLNSHLAEKLQQSENADLAQRLKKKNADLVLKLEEQNSRSVNTIRKLKQKLSTLQQNQRSSSDESISADSTELNDEPILINDANENVQNIGFAEQESLSEIIKSAKEELVALRQEYETQLADQTKVIESKNQIIAKLHVLLGDERAKYATDISERLADLYAAQNRVTELQKQIEDASNYIDTLKQELYDQNDEFNRIFSDQKDRFMKELYDQEAYFDRQISELKDYYKEKLNNTHTAHDDSQQHQNDPILAELRELNEQIGVERDLYKMQLQNTKVKQTTDSSDHSSSEDQSRLNSWAITIAKGALLLIACATVGAVVGYAIKNPDSSIAFATTEQLVKLGSAVEYVLEFMANHAPEKVKELMLG